MADAHATPVASARTAHGALHFVLAVAALMAAFTAVLARPLLAAPAARMHATLLSSEPAKGSTVSSSPTRIASCTATGLREWQRVQPSWTLRSCDFAGATA
jgi:methionine-rich copper-binding protein CopC